MASERPSSLTGLRWSLESADEHDQQHDRSQVRYWLSRPADERLAQAEAYRVRVSGAGPHALVGTIQWLPSVVDGEEQ